MTERKSVEMELLYKALHSGTEMKYRSRDVAGEKDWEQHKGGKNDSDRTRNKLLDEKKVVGVMNNTKRAIERYITHALRPAFSSVSSSRLLDLLTECRICSTTSELCVCERRREGGQEKNH